MKKLTRIPIFKFVLLFSLLTLLALSSVFPSGVVQAKNQDQEIAPDITYTLEDFDYQTDINFQGVRVNRTFNITFPEYWAFTADAEVIIKFSHAPNLHPISSMAVDWNGERMGSLLLTESNAPNGEYSISLPAEKLQPGYNALNIEFYMGISEEFCLDYDNPAVWAVVHNSTSIQVTPQINPRETELSLAPEILVDSSLLSENNLTLIIPDDPDVQHLNALAVMSTKLGQLAEWRDISIEVMTISEAKQSQPSGNLVLIATVDEIRELSPLLIPEITSAYDLYAEGDSARPPLSPNDGIVSLQISPFDVRYHILSLSGKTSDAVEKSTRAATFDSLFAQSSGSWAMVRRIPDLSGLGSKTPLTITMSDLGYDAMTAFGTQEQTIQFNLPLSSLWNVDSEAWLDLNFGHSQTLNRNRSTLSVMINSIPVASIALTPDNAVEGSEKVLIPLRYLKVGNNMITLQANMQFTDNVTDLKDYCTDDTFPRAWLTISPDTAVQLPDVSQQTPLNLSNFPFGFANPYTFDGLVYGLPAKPDQAALTALTKIAVTYGKGMLGNPATIQLKTTGEDLTAFEGYDHIILIGTIQNLVNESLNERLPIPIDLNTGLLQENNTVLSVDTMAGTGSYLQTFMDDQANIYLVVAASNPQGLLAAGEILSNPGLHSSLNGNIAVISAPDKAAAYQIEPSALPADQQPQITENQPLVALTGQSVWVLRVAIGVLAISVIVLVIALLRKNSIGRES